MDVVLPAVHPTMYFVTPTMLPRSPLIMTVAAARYIPSVCFLQQYISESQSIALAAALEAYRFLVPLPTMLFLENHWCNYLPALCNQITAILMLAIVTMPVIQQPTPSVQIALIVVQSASQPIATQLPPTILMVDNSRNPALPPLNSIDMVKRSKSPFVTSTPSNKKCNSKKRSSIEKPTKPKQLINLD
uniref:Uncharacterized protein n=1 Tax=Romanomermis culicivorax TaxID=13658 RepID=A0A915HVS3_ROMCU